MANNGTLSQFKEWYWMACLNKLDASQGNAPLSTIKDHITICKINGQYISILTSPINLFMREGLTL
eukprot:15359554-Ditylum_brightwellii.AAC.1